MTGHIMSSHLHAIVAQQHTADLLRRSAQRRQMTGDPAASHARSSRSRTAAAAARGAGGSRVGVRRRRAASRAR